MSDLQSKIDQIFSAVPNELIHELADLTSEAINLFAKEEVGSEDYLETENWILGLTGFLSLQPEEGYRLLGEGYTKMYQHIKQEKEA